MTLLRTKPQPNKTTGLPVGVSKTWRQRKQGQGRPYLEYQVLWKNQEGKNMVKHFYVGPSPSITKEKSVQAIAIKFRQIYEINIKEDEK